MASPAFDPRLITPARLLALAGEHPIVAGPHLRMPPHLSVDCGLCGQPIAKATDSKGVPYRFSAGQLLQDTLRHLVVAHDMPLSGAAGEIAGEISGESAEKAG
jgi:hypothetical protein